MWESIDNWAPSTPTGPESPTMMPTAVEEPPTEPIFASGLTPLNDIFDIFNFGALENLADGYENLSFVNEGSFCEINQPPYVMVPGDAVPNLLSELR